MKQTLFYFGALTLLLSIIFVGPASAINDDAWADDMTDWGYRVPISITNPPTAANVQRMISLTWQDGMQTDFDDIRFYTSDGSSIDYWIEEKTDSTSKCKHEDHIMNQNVNLLLFLLLTLVLLFASGYMIGYFSGRDRMLREQV